MVVHPRGTVDRGYRIRRENKVAVLPAAPVPQFEDRPGERSTVIAEPFHSSAAHPLLPEVHPLTIVAASTCLGQPLCITLFEPDNPWGLRPLPLDSASFHIFLPGVVKIRYPPITLPETRAFTGSRLFITEFVSRFPNTLTCLREPCLGS
ncbi:uncharacterized protein LOC143362515 [Halictus rubicundus]|uniref:uncharacterized protein LOC143362515 n=1 Tax=Halictus rubicundus TaxID=77578 RepID=UPI0040359C96